MSLIDLAGRQMGGEVVAMSDEFFAPAWRMLEPSEPEWREGVFTERGKWMDGWETRRRRRPGHDWCIIRLGAAGVVDRVVVDTTHFRGNHPEAFSLEACGLPADTNLAELLGAAPWEPLVERTPLAADTRNEVGVASRRRVTLLRLHIYPDGGVARFRAWGRPLPAPTDLSPEGRLPDLASAALGGVVEAVSDQFFSQPHHLLMPGPPQGMFDGWETRRRRGEGEDWVVLRLGVVGTPRQVVVDTAFFRGNAPATIRLEATLVPEGESAEEASWWQVVPESRVEADRLHLLPAIDVGAASHLRLVIAPDGGVARLRVYGDPEASAVEAIGFRYLNALFPSEGERFFRTACGSSRWVEAMVTGRPYPGWEELWAEAEEAFAALAPEDWREAFAAHPRIGERQGRQTREGEEMSAAEQEGTVGVDPQLTERLLSGQHRYEERVGFPFIVSAAGKSAEEMLAILERRLQTGPDDELRTAAGEQRAITRLRLRRMLGMTE